MAIQGIEGVLQQMQATMQVARNNAVETPPSVSFAGELQAALGRISDTQNAPALRRKNSQSARRAWR